LSGLGFSFVVSSPTVGRGSATIALASKLIHRTDAATYGDAGLTESFHPSAFGDIEQTFHIAHKAHGGGPLTIDIPISGLTAVTSGSSINLRDSAERIVTTYSGLGVTDAKGKSVPASMAASSGGSAIEITVQDARSDYPLTVDPTWSNPLLDLYVGAGGIEPVNPTTGAVGTNEDPPLTTGCGYCQMIVVPGDTTGYVLSWGGISGGENAATPVNLATGVFGTPVQVPGEADSITAAPNGQTVYVVSFNYGYSYLTAINTATNTEEYSDHIYPNIFDSAISPDGATLWLSGNGNYVFPLNLATGTQGAQITVPAYPTSLVMSPNGQTLFAVEGDGILPINLTTDAVGSLISVGIYGGPQSFAVAPNGQTGYVVGDGNTVTPVNLVTDTVGTPISLAGLPNNEGTQLVAMTVAPNGQMGYVLSQEGDVIPLNLATGAPGSPILGVSSGGYSLVQAPPASNVAPEATATEDASVHSPGCQHNITPRDPVDCASGDFFHTFTDDSVPGYGPTLDLTRTYNSLNATTEGIFGYGWSSSYDSHLVVNGDGSITITEGDGSQMTATPDGSGGFTVPSWADSTLTSSGGSYTFVRHQQQTFTFNSSGQLTSIVDPNGATTSLAYTSGKLYTVTDPSGRALTFAFGTNGLVSSVTDPMSRQTTYAYDASGNLTSVTDPLSRVTSFGYGTGASVHLMLTMTMPNGQTGGPDAGDHYANTYDSGGRVLTQTDPTGQETTYSYSGDNYSGSGGTTTITDPDGNVETQAYVDGQLQSATKGSSTWNYGFDQSTFGATSVEDPNGNVTVSEYDTSGNLVLQTNALGSTKTYAYNGFNEPTCAAGPLAANTCSSLTPPSAVSPGGTITPPTSAPPKYVTYTLYDTKGNELYQTTGDYAPGSGTASQSRTTYHLYNGNSVTLGGTNDSCTTSAPSNELPCATIDPNGVVTQLTYDSAGDLTSSSTPDGNAGAQVAKTTYGYDTDGEQTSMVAPNGNLTGANAGNYTTTKTYDADGELTSSTVGGGSGSTVVPRVTTYTYDADRNRTSESSSDSVALVGATSGHNSSSSLSLTLPGGTRAGDTAVLTTTIGSGAGPSLEHYAANDIYLVAGVPGDGAVGGLGQQANEGGELGAPNAVTLDAAGDVYVANQDTNTVEEIAATTHTQWGQSMTAGDIYLIAGSSSGTSGHTGDGGAAASATLDQPSGVAIDSAGDLYVADAGNNRIQEVPASSGTQWGQSMTANDIYTVAGSSSGTAGDSGNGGASTSATLDDPNGVALDSAGDLYIGDTLNNRIQEVAASTGTHWGQSMTANAIYTVAGSASGSLGDTGDGGAATSATLNGPAGIGFDAAGDLFIADLYNNRVQEVAAAPGTQWGQSMTANDMYTVAGSSSGSSGHTGDGGAATSAKLDEPAAVAFDASGNLYVADTSNNRIQEVPAVSGTRWGQSMTADDIYTVAGSSSGTSGDSGDGAAAASATLSSPAGIGFDAAGDLYVSEFGDDSVRMVAAQSETRVSGVPEDFYAVAGNEQSGGGASGDGGPAAPDGQLSGASGLAEDSAGDLYIADAGNNRIQETPATSGTGWGQSMTAGNTYTVAGSSSGSSGHTGDGGAATSAKLYDPAAVFVDSAGDLYIADAGNNRIQEVPATSGTHWGQSMTAGDMYTIAGSSSGSSGHSGNGGAATSAKLNDPTGIAFDSAGDLYIADAGNNRVQEVAASSGTQWGQSMTADDVYTVAGSSSGSSGHTGDGGAATSATMNSPGGIALDSAGDLYVADSANHRVQEVAHSTGTQWGQSMTANDIYTVAGSASASEGDSGVGGAATSALLDSPSALALDSAGNLYVSDAANAVVDEVPAASGTNWGQTMTADDLYVVAGGGTTAPSTSDPEDGEAATSVELANEGIAVDSSGDLLVADNVEVGEVVAPTTSSGSVTTPSGWTLQSSESSGATTTDVYTRELVSSDSGVTLDYSAAAPKVASVAVYRGVNPTSPIDVSSVGATSSGTSVAAASLSTTNPGDELVFIGAGTGQGTSPTWGAPSAMASVTTTSTSGVSDLIADGAGPAPAGSTGSTSATTSSSGALSAIELALAPGAVTTTTGYNADDEPTLVTDPDGNATLTCYDGDGNVAETVPPVGVATNSLSPASCPNAYPSGYGDRLATDATTTAYNALGERTTVTTPAPAGLSGDETTTYGYDSAGNLMSIAAPPTSNSGGAPNDVTDYTYDAANELLTTTTGAGTASAATTSYCYDPIGNKTATVPGDGNTSGVAACSSSSPYATSSSYQTTYSYDSLGELVTQTAPATTWAGSGQVTTTTYDPAGNVLTLDNPDGVTATNTYTPLGEVSGTSYSDSTHSVSYTYDADGGRTAMTDASGTSTSTYDPFGELISTENGASKTLSYSYDALGDTTSITYPLGSGATWATTDTVNYGYDAASVLTSVTDFNGNTSSVTNSADGLPTAISLGASGDTLSTSYDASDSPSSITLSNGSTLQEFAYSDVPSGSIASETDTPSGSLTPASYTYDAQSRVTQMTPGSGSANTYTNDASSNLTTLPTGSSSTTYDHASELTASVRSGTTTSYTYDASGNRTQASVAGTTTVSATYNGAAQLTSYSNPAANTSSATYDGDGMRTTATTTPSGGSASTANFVWDKTTPVPRVLMDSTNAYLYGPSGTPMEQVNLSSGTITYLSSDALGSVRGVVSSSGSLTASTSYDAYGNPETTGGLMSYTPFGFAGGYTDPTGLVYLVHRYYDPATGQFLNVDPLVDLTGAPYFYAGDDPVNEVDPSGNDWADVASAIISAIVQVGAILGYGHAGIQPPQNVEQPPAKVKPAEPAPRPNQEQLPPNKSGNSPSSGDEGCLDAEYSSSSATLVDCGGEPFGGLFGGGDDDIVPDDFEYPWNAICDPVLTTLYT
jgi:RHS repeat-associated protein